ncbi:MAG: GDP-mannose 4,6-dehydratase [Planctomycetes bacterium]|nr:GDP-mannose 4,6-dehydratase [Planctomycetota bacterium]
MNVLVTGGAGFIGSYLVEALLARGDTVAVIDDCSTGTLDNLRAVAAHPLLSIVHGSVCDELAVDECCATLRPELIIHLAAAVGVKRILERQVGSIVTNVRGTEVVLRAASQHGARRVIVASTSEVYGKQDKIPFREDDDSVLGATALHRWSYACAKMLDEFLALAYHRERGLPVVITRFFNITGPRQSPAYGMVLPRFCQAAVANGTIQVHGDGEQTRTFLHVADAVSALIALAGCDAAVGRVVNVGGTEEVSMRTLAQAVRAAAGTGSITLVPYASAYPTGFEDMRRRVPDTTRLRQMTGWAPTKDLRQIIADALADARGQSDITA